MTDCNGCGACCDPVSLAYTQTEALTRVGLDPDDRRFIVEDLRPLSQREGRRRAFWIGELEVERGQVWQGLDGSPLRFDYECRHFDPVSRRCLNYEHRPPLCRRFPWQGRPPPGVALPPPCSYRADIGQPVEEVAVFLSRRPA